MPNIASIFKAEIIRLARKEVREESEALKRTVALQRKEIAGLKGRVLSLEKAVRQVGKGVPGTDAGEGAAATKVDEAGRSAQGLRFRASGLASNRRRLGLSAADFALLVGTTGQSIYAWEAGKVRPRAQALQALAELRHVSRREVEVRLAALKR